jgi:ketosteroid isomerase-like protein
MRSFRIQLDLRYSCPSFAVQHKDFSAISRRLDEAVAELSKPNPAAAIGHHVRSVQQQIDAIGRGDLESAVANAHEDVTLEIFAPPEFQWIRRASGVENLRQAIQHNFESLDEQHPEITSVTAQGDTVVLIGRERGRIKATGAPYDVEFVERFVFREGRLAAVKIIAARAV